LKTYRPTRELISEVKKLLASRDVYSSRVSPLEKVLDVLYQGRHYFWIGIYLVIGDRVERQFFRGPVPPCHSFALGTGNVGTAGQTGVLKVVSDVSADPTYSMCFVETKSEIVVPIKIAGRILGVIDVESDKPDAFAMRDRILLKLVAEQLARFLTSTGKYLVRHAREKAAEEAKKVPQAKSAQPASERPERMRAAVGERSH
jgi:GAF domain-containing protein